MNKKIVHIFFAINDGYSEHCAVTMTSILENNQKRYFAFHILTDAITYPNRKKLNRISKKYKNAMVTIHPVKDERFSLLGRNIDYITEHTYYRYMLADMFPNIDRGLYLDCDLVVDGDLTPLIDTDLSDLFCAGVEDLYILKTGYKSILGLSDDDLYINAGVLWLNLEKMRRENISKQLFEKTEEMQHRIEYQDQDIINLIFRSKIKPVDMVFNFAAENVFSCRERHSDAVIIHYTGENKPWLKDRKCNNALRKVYFKYLKRSPYAFSIWGYRLAKIKNKLIHFTQKK